MSNSDGGILEAENGYVEIEAEGALSNDQSTIVATQGSITLKTDSLLTNTNGTISAAGNLTANAATLKNTDASSLQSTGGNVQLSSAGLLENSGGSKIVATKGDITLTAGGALTNDQAEINASAGQVTLTSQELLTNTHLVSAAKNLTLNAGALHNIGSLQSHGGNIKVKSQGALQNSDDGKIVAAEGDIELDTDGDLSNSDATIQASEGNVKLTSQGQLTNNNLISAGQQLAVEAQSLLNTAKLYSTGSDVSVTTADSLSNSGSIVATVGKVTLAAGETLSNTGLISAGKDLIVKDTKTLENSEATAAFHSSGGNINVGTSEVLSNVGGKIIAETGNIVLDSQGTLSNNGGSITTNKGNISLTAQQQLSNNALISAGHHLTLTGGSVFNSGPDASLESRLGNIKLTSTSGVLSNSDGGKIVAAEGDIELVAEGDLTNDEASIQATKGKVILTSEKALSNTQGGTIVAAKGDIELTTKGKLTNAELISSEKDLTVQAGSVLNQGDTAVLQSAMGNLSLSATTGELLNGHGSKIVATAGKIDLTAEGQLSNAGLISAAKDLTVQAGAVLNQGREAVLQSVTGNLSLSTATGDLVNSQGSKIVAAAGKIDLTAEGQLSNAGLISAAKDLTVQAGSVLNQGDKAVLQSTAGNIDLTAIGQLSNTGLIVADKALAATASTLLNQGDKAVLQSNQGNVSLKTTTGELVNTQGSKIVAVAGNIDLTATGQLSNTGLIVADKALTATASTLLNQGDKAVLQSNTGNVSLNATTGDLVNTQGSKIAAAAGNIDLTATGQLSNAGSIVADKALTATAGTLLNNSGTMSAGKNVTAQGAFILNKGKDAWLQSTGGTLELTATTGTLSNLDGATIAAEKGDLTLTAQGDLNNHGATINAQQGAVTLNTQGALSNTKVISAGQNLTANAHSLLNSGATAVLQSTGGDVTLTTEANLDNQAGASIIAALGKVDLKAGGALTNNAASIHADKDVKLESAGVLSNSAKASISSANGDVSLHALSINNTQANVVAGGKLSVTATEGVNNTQGAILSAQTGLTLDALTLNNQDQAKILNHGGTLNLTTAGAISNTNNALIQNTTGNIEIDATSLVNTQSKLLAGGTLSTITSGDITNTQGGQIASEGTLTLQAQHILNDAATISGGLQSTVTAQANIINKNQAALIAKELTLQAQNIANSDSTIAATEEGLTLHATQSVVNQGTDAQIVADKGTLIVTAESLTNKEGALIQASLNTVDLTTTGGLNNQGKDSKIIAGKNIVAKVGGALNNQDQAILSATQNATLTVVTGDINNTQATIAAGNDLTLTAANVNNQAATLGAGQDVSVIAQGIINNDQGGKIEAQRALKLQAETLKNLAGSRIVSMGSLDAKIGAGGILNSGKDSLIGAKGKVVLASASSVINSDQAAILSEEDELSIDAKGTVDNTSDASLRGNSVKISGATVTNDNASIQADTTLTLKSATSVDNRKGLIQAGTALSITADKGAIVNDGASLLGQSINLKASGNIINQDAEIIAGQKLTMAGKELTNNALIQAGTGGITATLNGNANNTGADAKMLTDGTMKINAVNINNSQKGALLQAKDLELIATQNVNNDGASIQALNNATISGVSINNQNKADISANNNIIFTATNALNNQAKIVAGGLVKSTAQIFSNTGAGKVSANDIELTQKEYINTDKNGISAQNNATLTLTHNQNYITGDNNWNALAGGTLTINAKDVKAESQAINNPGNVIINATGDVAVASKQAIISGKSLTVNASKGTITNEKSGLMFAANNVTLKSNALNNNEGAQILAMKGDATLDVNGTLNNTAAKIEAGQDIIIDAKEFNNIGVKSGGVVVGKGSTFTQQVTVEEGWNWSNKTTLTVTPLMLSSDVNVAVASVNAGRDIKINTKSKGTINNDGGVISAVKNITTAGVVNNISVVNQFDYLTAKIGFSFRFRRSAASGIEVLYYDTNLESIADIFDFIASDVKNAGLMWGGLVRMKNDLPAHIRDTISQVVGTNDWGSVNVTEKWSAFKGNQANLPVYAKQQSAIYAGGDIVHSGKFNNGSATVQLTKTQTVNIGEQQVTTLLGELGSVTAQALQTIDSLEQVASLTANPHLFGTSTKPRPPQTIDFAAQPVLNKPDTVVLDGANAALNAINTITNGLVTTGAGAVLSTLTVTPDQNIGAWLGLESGGGQVTVAVLDNGSVAVTVTHPDRPTTITTLSLGDGLSLLGAISKPRPPIIAGFVPPTVFPLYETNLSYIDQSQYYGSNYFFQQIGYNPGITVPVIGDTYFEHMLLTQSIQQLSGTLLNDKYKQTGAALIQTLLDQGAQQGYQYGLTVGVAPTAAELAKLQDDIVWYVAQQVEGMTVLVPQVFLASATQSALQNQHNVGGASVVAGGKINIDAGANDVSNVNGLIKGGQGVTIVTEGNVSNVASGKGQGGIVSGMGNGSTVSIQAGGNILNQGASISGSHVNLTAGKNIDISTTMSVDSSGKLVSNKNGGVSAGGNVSLSAGNNVVVTAAEITGGQQVSIKTGGDLLVNDVHEFSSSIKHETKDLFTDGAIGSSTEITANATSTGSAINANKLKLDIGGNAMITGSNITALESDVNVAGDMKIATGVDYDYEHKESWALGFGSGASVGAGGHEAGASTSTISKSKTHAGEGKTSGANVSAGIEFEQSSETTNSIKNNNSQINFGSGKVTVGGTFDIGGADINTSKDSQNATLAVSAGEIESTKYEDMTDTKSSSTSFSLGVKVTGGSSILDGVSQIGSNVTNLVNQDWQTGTGGANGAAAGGAISTTALNGAAVAGAVLGVINGDLVSGSAKVAFDLAHTNSSKTETKENITKIGGNISLATTKGDVNLNGVAFNGGTFEVDSAGSINMAAAKSTLTSDSSGGSVSLSAGGEVACSVAGCGAGLGAAVGGGYNDTHTDSTTYTNTQINGTQVTLNAKKDLTMVGANVSADTVNLDVQGNTTITSVQDTVNTLNYDVNLDLSAGGGVHSTTLGMVTGGATIGGGASWENTKKVGTQSGINATQSITANVGGDLTLTGASIVSQTGAGDINVDGKIIANTLKDTQDIDGVHGSVGFQQSISGMPTVNLSGGRDESTHYGADNNATIAVNSVKSQAVVGNLNSDKDKTTTVTMNEKWAAADASLSFSTKKKPTTKTETSSSSTTTTTGGGNSFESNKTTTGGGIKDKTTTTTTHSLGKDKQTTTTQIHTTPTTTTTTTQVENAGHTTTVQKQKVVTTTNPIITDKPSIKITEPSVTTTITTTTTTNTTTTSPLIPMPDKIVTWLSKNAPQKIPVLSALSDLVTKLPVIGKPFGDKVTTTVNVSQPVVTTTPGAVDGFHLPIVKPGTHTVTQSKPIVTHEHKLSIKETVVVAPTRPETAPVPTTGSGTTPTTSDNSGGGTTAEKPLNPHQATEGQVSLPQKPTVTTVDSQQPQQVVVVRPVKTATIEVAPSLPDIQFTKPSPDDYLKPHQGGRPQLGNGNSGTVDRPVGGQYVKDEAGHWKPAVTATSQGTNSVDPLFHMNPNGRPTVMPGHWTSEYNKL